MSAIDETVQLIVGASHWDERVARFRQIPQRHGTNEHAAIYAQVAKLLYVPYLAPDYAYVPSAEFYEAAHFETAYATLAAATDAFGNVSAPELARVIESEPTVLLPLRTITGLTRSEFADSTRLVAELSDSRPLSVSKVDSMERLGSKTTSAQAVVAAETINRIMHGMMFGDPPTDEWRSKQDKPDTTSLAVSRQVRHGRWGMLSVAGVPERRRVRALVATRAREVRVLPAAA